MASLGKASRVVERLDFVGAVRVGVESESCWSVWSRAVRMRVWSVVIIGV